MKTIAVGMQTVEMPRRQIGQRVRVHPHHPKAADFPGEYIIVGVCLQDVRKGNPPWWDCSISTASELRRRETPCEGWAEDDLEVIA